jgi:DNA (cytosine-5)-methyltransferase 1
MKVLNLYAGIGGNRKLWENVEVTAVEMNPEIAAVYQGFFPDDTVIVGDAHQYLLDHYKEFDFIWASPPCPTHSRARFWRYGNEKPVYPDMTLYQEIVLLDNHYKAKWIVENVIPYYEPLIPAQYKLSRHLFWCNFRIDFFYSERNEAFNQINIKGLSDLHNIKDFSATNKLKLLRNCVEPELGKHIFDCAFNGKSNTLFDSAELIQANLF